MNPSSPAERPHSLELTFFPPFSSPPTMQEYTELPNEEKNAADDESLKQCSNARCGVTLSFPVGTRAVQVRLLVPSSPRTVLPASRVVTGLARPLASPARVFCCCGVISLQLPRLAHNVICSHISVCTRLSTSVWGLPPALLCSCFALMILCFEVALVQMPLYSGARRAQ